MWEPQVLRRTKLFGTLVTVSVSMLPISDWMTVFSSGILWTDFLKQPNASFKRTNCLPVVLRTHSQKHNILLLLPTTADSAAFVHKKKQLSQDIFDAVLVEPAICCANAIYFFLVSLLLSLVLHRQILPWEQTSYVYVSSHISCFFKLFNSPADT
jgi:hypothetical protein